VRNPATAGCIVEVTKSSSSTFSCEPTNLAMNPWFVFSRNW